MILRIIFFAAHVVLSRCGVGHEPCPVASDAPLIPISSMVHNTDSLEWHPGSFGRDTVVYALGTLGAAVLRRALADATVTDQYRQWIDSCSLEGSEGPQSKALITTGVHGGSVTLYARQRSKEFCLECQHTAFRAVVALGFDDRSSDLQGVFVASFEGDEAFASAFALGLAQQVREAEEPVTGERPAPPPSFQRPSSSRKPS